MEPTFSVIVPVYNAGRLLTEAAGSVFAQDFGDYELILVDDGSTDGSGARCDEYMRRDPRVRVIHQKNKGLAAARNSGIDLAGGRYLLFLDADDFYTDKKVFSRIYEVILRFAPDVICFNYARHKNGRMSEAELRFPTETGPVEPVRLLEQNTYQSSACIKSVRRAVVLERELRFPAGLLAEDILWSARLLHAAGSFCCIGDVLYAYRVTPGSLTRNIGRHAFFSQLAILETLTDGKPSGPNLDAYLGFLAFQYCTLLINWRLAGSPANDNAAARIKAISSLLEYSEYSIVKIVRTVYGILGLGGTSRLLRLYHALFRP